jgi:hypothetical protein
VCRCFDRFFCTVMRTFPYLHVSIRRAYLIFPDLLTVIIFREHCKCEISPSSCFCFSSPDMLLFYKVLNLVWFRFQFTRVWLRMANRSVWRFFVTCVGSWMHCPEKRTGNYQGPWRLNDVHEYIKPRSTWSFCSLSNGGMCAAISRTDDLLPGDVECQDVLRI